ncbi:MAG: hypothetical protein IJQ74_04835, partial [Synergistaceae bacterium]|nr:hypothetical protein [Synergistaceae bacterium]
MRKIFNKAVKYFGTGLLVLSLGSSAFAAAVAAPSAGAPMIMAPSATSPAVLTAPSPMNAVPDVMSTTPSIPTGPSIPTTGTGGINLSGLDSTQPSNRITTENVDLTQGGTNTTGQTEIGTGTNAETSDGQNDRTGMLTEQEVNDYFDRLLNRSEGNPMGDLFRRLPRYGMSFFRRPPSTYAPQDSVPVTQGYRIGVGDEMMLTIWG